MIRRCTAADLATIDSIINEAAQKYRGVIPADCWHEPYMTRADLEREIAAGVNFSGWEADGELAGVMGVQRVKDATLIRHAYVRTSQQGKGIGGKLLRTELRERQLLSPNRSYRGPAVITEYSATTMVLPGMRYRVDGAGNLLVDTK